MKKSKTQSEVVKSMLSDKKSSIKRFLYILIGSFFIALSANMFFVSQGLVTGGITGLGIILNEYMNIPLWFVNFGANIPLFLISWFIKGKEFCCRCALGMTFFTVFLYLTENVTALTDDLLLSAIYGGIIGGAGTGFVFLGLGTTGGTDTIAVIVNHFFPYISLGDALRIIEVSIIVLGAIVFGVEKSLFALIAIYIFTKMTDIVVNGFEYSKCIFIISDKYEEITECIHNDLARGVTCLNGEGMFTKKEKNVILCAVKLKELPRLKEFVKVIDNKAFMIVCDANEVLGMGFEKEEKI